MAITSECPVCRSISARSRSGEIEPLFIAHDELAHVEYVPPQVVTEYFRSVFRMLDRSRLTGNRWYFADLQGGERKVVVMSAKRNGWMVVRREHPRDTGN
jgi:hypothetical protein